MIKTKFCGTWMGGSLDYSFGSHRHIVRFLMGKEEARTDKREPPECTSLFYWIRNVHTGSPVGRCCNSICWMDPMLKNTDGSCA